MKRKKGNSKRKGSRSKDRGGREGRPPTHQCIDGQDNSTTALSSVDADDVVGDDGHEEGANSSTQVLGLEDAGEREAEAEAEAEQESDVAEATDKDTQSKERVDGKYQLYFKAA